MPQPMKPRVGQAFYDHSRVLESRPACAIKIAVIASDWARIEGAMARWFAYAVGETTYPAADTVSVKANAAFMAALTAIENLHLRIVAIRAAMQDAFSEEEAEQFELLVQELRARAGERNIAVHTPWAATDRYPDDVLRREGEKWIRYTPKDFDSIIDRLEAAEFHLLLFTRRWLPWMK